MDAITEPHSSECLNSCSYNFLHLTLQVAAYHISTMGLQEQEQLLGAICIESHLRNTCQFLAGLTLFRGMDRAILRRVIEKEYEEKKKREQLPSNLPWTGEMSSYVLHLLYECGEMGLLDSDQTYKCLLTDYSALLDFSTLGYCIAHSSCKWSLQLGTITQPMRSTDGVKLLVQEVNKHNSHSFIIESIDFWHEETECVQKLLLGLPQNTLPFIEKLVLYSKTLHPCALPHCLPELVCKMNGLCQLRLDRATADTIASALLVISTSNLDDLSLLGSQFNLPVMKACCKVLLMNKNSITDLRLQSCGINDNKPAAWQ